MLQDLNSSFVIDWACCVDEAFKKLSTGQYDVVVSDYEMPQKDGLQFLMELREQNNEIPFVLFTGKGREEVAIKALNLGADGYHNKQGSPETVYGELSHSINLTVDRRKAKLALSESERRYRALMEKASDAICIHDLKGRIIDANQRAYKSLGYSKEELLKMGIGDIDSEALQTGKYGLMWSKVIAGESFVFEANQKRKDGSIFPAEVSLGPIAFGDTTFVMGLVRDITERKKAEAALLLSEEKFRNLSDQSPNMIFINRKRKVVYANKKCEEATGYTQEELLSPKFDFFRLCTRENIDTFKWAFDRHSRGEDVPPYEYTLVPKDGKKIEVIITTKLIDYENEKAILGIVTDITERKKNEELLLRSEERFRQLSNNVEEWVWEVDSNGLYTYSSSVVEKLLGYTPEEIVGKKYFYDLFPVDEREELKKAAFAAFASKSTFNGFLNRNVHKNGNIAWLSTSGLPILNKKGDLLGYRGLDSDITERKKTEDALRKGLSDLEDSQRIAGLGTYIWNISTGVFKSSQILDNLFGIDKTYDHTTEGWISLIHPDDRAMMVNYVQNEVVGRKLLFDKEYRIVRPIDKAMRFLHGLGKLEFDADGKPITMYGTIQDITERKKSEDALRQERGMLESVTKNIGAGLVMISKDYKILWMNNFLKQLTGASENNHCYSSFNTCTTICPDCGPKKIFAGAQFDSREYCNQTNFNKDHPVWFELIATPIKDADGNVVAALELTVNITEKKEAEQKLRKNSEKIELINEKLHVVGSLARHDVGNKLMAAKSNLYLLKKRISENPDLVKYLDGIDSALASSDEIFEFSRLYERIGVEKPSKENVFECFNQAVALMPDLGDVEVVNETQGLVVVADSLLKQLFYNFVDNSLKHGEKVTHIILHYAEDGDGVKLFYEDNGVGIPDANKPKLFESGFTTGKGTGLGLYLVKKMMDVYGWTITEEGEAGKGAKFVIRVPPRDKR